MADTKLYQRVDINHVLDELHELDNIPCRAKGRKPQNSEIQLKNGADPELIEWFGEAESLEQRNLAIPPDYRKFLEFTNGASIFGIEFYDVDNVKWHKIRYTASDCKKRTMKSAYSIARWCKDSEILLDLNLVNGAENPNRRNVIESYDDSAIVIAMSFGEFLYRVIEGGKTHDTAADGPRYWKGLGSSGAPHPEVLANFNKARYWLERTFTPYRHVEDVRILNR